MKITTTGIDLAKTVLQVHGVDKQGNVGLAKQLKRKDVLSFFANSPKPTEIEFSHGLGCEPPQPFHRSILEVPQPPDAQRHLDNKLDVTVVP